MKRARLEQSGVKSTADHIDVIAEEFVRGNEHRLASLVILCIYIICMQVFEAFQMY